VVWHGGLVLKEVFNCGHWNCHVSSVALNTTAVCRMRRIVAINEMFNTAFIHLIYVRTLEQPMNSSSTLHSILPAWSRSLNARQDKFILRYISTVNGFCQFHSNL